MAPSPLFIAIEAFLDAMVYANGLTALTCDAYRRDLRALARAMEARGRKRWDAVTTHDLQAWFVEQSKAEYAETTQHRRAAAMRRFFLWLLDENEIPISPTDGFILGKSERLRLPKVVDEKTLNRLIEAVDGDTLEEVRDRAILEVLYGCGLRVTELCTLRLQDVDLPALHLRVTGKGRKERVVPFGRLAKSAMLRWLEMRERFIKTYRDGKRWLENTDATSPFFLSPTARAFNRSAVAQIVHARIHAFLPEGMDATPHTLRHSFATHLLDNGAPLLDIRNLLGHASIDTTQIYTHTTASSLKETFKRCFPRG